MYSNLVSLVSFNIKAGRVQLQLCVNKIYICHKTNLRTVMLKSDYVLKMIELCGAVPSTVRKIPNVDF